MSVAHWYEPVVLLYFLSTLSRGAGIGGLGITVEGPSESKINCRDNKDGSCSAEYIPFAPGDYDVNITYGGDHIPGKLSLRKEPKEQLILHTSLNKKNSLTFVVAAKGEYSLELHLQE